MEITNVSICTNVRTTTISNCINKTIKSAGKFLWVRKGDIPIKYNNTACILRNRIIMTKRKRVMQIDPNTNETIDIFQSATEASKKMKCCMSTIVSVCRKEKISVGFKWSYY